jgi:hypothetical protein
VNDLTASKHGHQLALVPFRQKPADVLDLEVQIVVVRLRTQLDLLQQDRGLVLPRLLLLLGGLVLELAEVHDLAHRRRGARIDLDQLQPLLFSEAHRLVSREDSDLTAVSADHPDFGDANSTSHAVVVCSTRGLKTWSCDD